MKKFSNYLLTVLIIIFGICLIAFSKSNILSVQSSLDLFLNAIFPSLFPFLIVCELLSYTFVFSFLSTKFGRIMNSVFNVSSIGAYPFVLGLFSGYPVGARIVSSLRQENKISKSDGEKLLVFTNNAGPIFILGTIGIGMYGSAKIGFLLYFIHIISSITIGIILGKLYRNMYRDAVSSTYMDFSTFGEIVSSSIKKAFYTLSTVCGFVILFSLVISMIQVSGILNFINNIWIQNFILGLIEITSGINLISGISSTNLLVKLLFTSFLLGTGGISVLLQVWSVISDSDLSIKPYFIAKILNGALSSVILYLAYLFVM